MKKAILILLILSLPVAAWGKALNLISVFYQNTTKEYRDEGLPGFTQKYESWGAGMVRYMAQPGSQFGIYTANSLFVPVSYDYGNLNPPGTGNFGDFRIGFDTLTGGAVNFGSGRVGFLLGAGLHLNYLFLYTDPLTEAPLYRYNSNSYLNIGLGGAGHIYVQVNDQVNIHAGANYTYDFWELTDNFDLRQYNGFRSNQSWAVLFGVGVKF